MRITFLLSICFAFTCCKVGNVASTQGLPDQGLLYFVSASKYSNPVSVTIDDKTMFDAKVNKEKKHTIKGETYAVATGKRHVKVSYNNRLIYDKAIFISTQETKKITLP
jgi:hypothetical protein